MKYCFVLGGFAGTRLRLADTGYLYFPDRASLYHYGLSPLALDLNGRTASPLGGRELFGSDDYNQYLQPLMRSISRKTAYTAVYTPWDWRKSIPEEGAKLAMAIRTLGDNSGPHTIVAHSTGGLVARFAWASLVAAGKSHLIRRIVTLGTPHRGTLAAAKILRFQNAMLQALTAIPTCKPEVAVFRNRAFVFSREILRVVSTFPSIYQLLPPVDSEQLAADPLTPGLYDAANYPSQTSVLQGWLTYARDTFQSLLAASSATPPYEVLTTVGGVGAETPKKMKSLPYDADYDWHTSTSSGDGTVTYESATSPHSKKHVVPTDHMGIAGCAYVLNRIKHWIEEERASVPSPTFPETVAGPVARSSSTELTPLWEDSSEATPAPAQGESVIPPVFLPQADLPSAPTRVPETRPSAGTPFKDIPDGPVRTRVTTPRRRR